MSPSSSFRNLRVVLGLLIVVQGFETSRYLGDAHPAEQRIATMRRAQLVSAGIYLAFIGLATVLFHDGLGTDVTAIIAMARPVALVLPILLAVAGGALGLAVGFGLISLSRAAVPGLPMSTPPTR